MANQNQNQDKNPNQSGKRGFSGMDKEQQKDFSKKGNAGSRENKQRQDLSDSSRDVTNSAQEQESGKKNRPAKSGKGTKSTH